jgi:hypothetical protein
MVETTGGMDTDSMRGRTQHRTDARRLLRVKPRVMSASVVIAFFLASCTPSTNDRPARSGRSQPPTAVTPLGTTPAPATTTHTRPEADNKVRHEIHGARPCYVVSVPIVRVRVEPDGALRDCLVVRPHQRLTVANRTTDFHQTGEPIGVRWFSKSVDDLAPGHTVRLGQISPRLNQGFHDITFRTADAVNVVELYVCLGTVTVRPALACVNST